MRRLVNYRLTASWEPLYVVQYRRCSADAAFGSTTENAAASETQLQRRTDSSSLQQGLALSAMAASAGTAASTRGSVRCSAPAHIYTTAAHLWATPLPRQRRADQRCRQASLDRAGGGTPSRPQTNLGAAARDPSSIPDDLIQELGASADIHQAAHYSAQPARSQG